MTTPEDPKAAMLAAIENNECFVTGAPQNGLRERFDLPLTTDEAVRARRAQIQAAAPRRGLWLKGRPPKNKA